MAWARHQPKQLRAGENKVEYLRDKEEEERLGKVRLDAHDRERHARQVAERITRKRTRRVPDGRSNKFQERNVRRKWIHTPVVVQEAKADSHERKHEVQTEEVTLDQFCTPICHACAPNAAHFNVCATPEKMQWDTETSWPGKVQQIVKGHRKSNYERLRDLGSVDPCKDVDAIGREGGEKQHV